MSIDEKIELVRTMIDPIGADAEINTDAVILAYLRLAGRKVIDRCYPYRSDVKDVPARYAMNQVEIAVYLMNKRGGEGETAHGENGVSREYESAGVPESMLKNIVPFCEGAAV